VEVEKDAVARMFLERLYQVNSKKRENHSNSRPSCDDIAGTCDHGRRRLDGCSEHCRMDEGQLMLDEDGTAMAMELLMVAVVVVVVMVQKKCGLFRF
jgi:hypothetical protein